MILLFIFACLTTTAQPGHQATLTEAPVKGFYIIDLPLSVRAYARQDLSDLRVMNGKGEQMPYLVRKDIQIYDKDEFVPYPILSQSFDKRHSHYLIDSRRDTISSLVLNIKNADAYKTANLKGSNDTVNWFTVKEHLVLTGNFNSHAPSTLQSIDFPLSDYAYYLLTIDDSLSAPLNITAIGKMNSNYQVFRHLAEVPGEMKISHQGDTSIICLDYNEMYPVSGIRLYVSSPEFFRRPVSLQDTQGYAVRSVINSEQSGSLFLPWQHKTSQLSLLIFNGDNPALRIDSVRSFSDRLFLITYLPEAGQYSLTFDDTKARTPKYDLIFFENKIPADMQKLDIISVQKNESPDTTVHENTFMLFLRKYGIWLLIIAVSVQLLYMVKRMMRE